MKETCCSLLPWPKHYQQKGFCPPFNSYGRNARMLEDLKQCSHSSYFKALQSVRYWVFCEIQSLETMWRWSCDWWAQRYDPGNFKVSIIFADFNFSCQSNFSLLRYKVSMMHGPLFSGLWHFQSPSVATFNLVPIKQLTSSLVSMQKIARSGTQINIYVLSHVK